MKVNNLMKHCSKYQSQFMINSLRQYSSRVPEIDKCLYKTLGVKKDSNT